MRYRKYLFEINDPILIMDLMKIDLLIQAGVSIRRLERNTRRGLNTVWTIFTKYKQRTIVTSTDEGDHMAGSLHYCDQAFDVEPPKDDSFKILEDCREALGDDWDIETKFTYWHFEYDPKTAKEKRR